MDPESVCPCLVRWAMLIWGFPKIGVPVWGVPVQGNLFHLGSKPGTLSLGNTYIVGHI